MGRWKSAGLPPAEEQAQQSETNPAEDLAYQVESAATRGDADLGMVEVQLVEQGRLVALEQGDALPAVQAENFIRQHQIPLGIAAGLGVGENLVYQVESAAASGDADLGMVEVTIDGVCGDDEVDDSPPGR